MPVTRPTRGFAFGPFQLDCDTGELRNNGAPVHLQPQPLQVLSLLLERSGQLVTREELQHRLWPKETFVEFEVGLNQAIKKLREGLRDSPHQPVYIETVPRMGYRFIFPVQEIHAEDIGRSPSTPAIKHDVVRSREPPDAQKNAFGRRSRLVISAFAVGALLLAGFFLLRHQYRPEFSGQAIAVVPFRDLTQDPQLAWLGSGMAEMLTTNLAQVKGIDLISPERLVRAEQKLKNGKTSLNPPDVAREAGAKLFVTGSVLKISPSKIVIEVRLQEVDRGKVLFSEMMKAEDVADIFQMANSTTDRLSKVLLPGTDVPEQRADVEQVLTSNIEALRHYQAAASYGRRMQNTEAIREYEQAVRLDPQFAKAYLELFGKYRSLGDAGRALDDLRSAEHLQNRLPQSSKLELQAWMATLSGDMIEVIRVREEILRSDPRNVENRSELSSAYIINGQAQRAVNVMHEGEALDPNDTFLASQSPYVEGWAGNEAGALEACRRYAALAGPNEPDPWSAFGDMYYLFGRTKEAVKAYRKLLELDPNFARFGAHQALAVIYADGGDPQLAEWFLREYRERVSGVWQTDAASFEAQLHQFRGDPEGSLAVYERLVPALISIDQDRMAESTLRVYASTSILLGKSRDAANFVRRQSLHGRELLVLSSLMAGTGDLEGSEALLSEYTSRRPEPEYLGADRERGFNSLRVALARKDREAAKDALQHLPSPLLTPGEFGRRSELLVSGEAHLLLQDYAAAESDLKLLATSQRMLSAYRQGRSQSPLLEHISHFYLGQTHEAAGHRAEALREYQAFLSRYRNSNSRLSQIAEARSAIRRIGL